MFFWLLLWAFVMPDALQAQKGNVYTVLDYKTRKAIPYVSVFLLPARTGTYANESGEVVLQPDVTVDSLVFSCVGYTIKRLKLTEIKDTYVYLEPVETSLPDVMVQRKKITGTQVFGFTQARQVVQWASSGAGEAFVQKIAFTDDGKTYKLKSVRIGMSRFDTTVPTVLRIYDTTAAGLPGNDLLTRQVIVRKADFKKSKRYIEVDISTLNIYIRQRNCFVGIEWLPTSYHKKLWPSSAIILTDQIAQDLTYSFSLLFGASGSWFPLSGFKNFQAFQTKTANMVVSVEADVLE
jgi:hypothetical protein